MELRSQLIRPSRNKHRSKAVMAVRLLDRQETVKKLEEELGRAKSEWELQESEARELWNNIQSQEKQFQHDDQISNHHFKENERIQEKADILIEKEEAEYSRLMEESELINQQMKDLESETQQLNARLKFLQNYQNTLSDVEGFDRVVSKFQELNQTWQNMSQEYKTILAIPGHSSSKRDPTEMRMECLVAVNKADVERTRAQEAEISSDKTSRLRNWTISSVTESFKQHGHTYLAILNLASHLSHHSVSRALMNIGNMANKRKANKGKKDVKKEENQEEESAGLWKKAATAVLHHLQVRDALSPRSGSDIDKRADSLCVELPQPVKQEVSPSLKDGPHRSAAESERKGGDLNQVAAAKLEFIEQMLYDLTLIKEEIEFQTDPIHYNDAFHSMSCSK